MKRYAIFFPQFHCVEVNDLAWGHGFTDWVLVSTANAFEYWDRRAPACGFYNLANPEDVQQNFITAANAGLDGFGLYHYYFDDGPELSAVERYLKRAKIPTGFHYFFIWANENWSRRWAGKNTEILKRMSAIPTRRHIRDHVNYLVPYLQSDQYMRIKNKPVFTIYRPSTFKNADITIGLYREEFWRHRLEPLVGYFMKDVSEVEYSDIFDFCYLFEPRLFFNFSGVRKSKTAIALFKKIIQVTNGENSEMISERVSRLINRGPRTYSFDCFMKYLNSSARMALVRSIRCPVQTVLSCGWNNVPRYRHRYTKLETPSAEQLSNTLRLSAKNKNYSDLLPILCNAWNEWSEGAAIEPCKYLGDSLLSSFVSLTISGTERIDEHGFDVCRI